ncbi:MAG: hypothetical protein AB7D01_01265 [Methanoculleus sp.]|jgi:hypothetical protein
MNGNIGMRALSALFAVLLVSMGVVPAMACEPGTPCGDAREDLQKTDLSGLEKYEAVASALNLDDVKKLSDISRSEDFSMIVDNAKAFSFEKELEDGSIKHATAVVLPIESVIEKDGLVQTSNIVAVWDGDNARVLKYTCIFQEKSLYTLDFSIIDVNGDVVKETIIDEGSFIKETSEHLFATEEDPDYWQRVVYCITLNCACALAGIPCPGISVCEICIVLLQPCVVFMTPYTCAPAVACLGVEIAACMYDSL